jgi:hypothetical protein
MLAIENVFNNVTESVKQGITKLWKAEGAITEDHKIQERLAQVVCVVLNSKGDFVGVSTAEKKKVPALNDNYFFEFRCFITEASRVAGLDVKLSKTTFDILESASKTDKNNPIGILSVLENEQLMKQPLWRRAVWPEIEMYFVGFTNHGNPIRVHYFKNARI